MALKITDDCINCNACLPACPNAAIYRPGEAWTMAEGTALIGTLQLVDGRAVDAAGPQSALATDIHHKLLAN